MVSCSKTVGISIGTKSWFGERTHSLHTLDYVGIALVAITEQSISMRVSNT